MTGRFPWGTLGEAERPPVHWHVMAIDENGAGEEDRVLACLHHFPPRAFVLWVARGLRPGEFVAVWEEPGYREGCLSRGALLCR
jgi:hypothetical protein